MNGRHSLVFGKGPHTTAHATTPDMSAAIIRRPAIGMRANTAKQAQPMIVAMLKAIRGTSVRYKYTGRIGVIAPKVAMGTTGSPRISANLDKAIAPLAARVAK